MSLLSNRNSNNTRSVTLVPSFLTLFLKVQFILKSIIRGVLLPKLFWWPMSLIPSVRSLASKCTAYYFKLVAVILLLDEIIPTCSYYMEKGLVYIAIIALLGRQPSSYAKCTKLNIYLSYNIHSVSDVECIFLTYFYTFRSL